MRCKEEIFYDAIGEWLIKEKGCQQDEYSQGYLKNVQIENIRPDVFGIKYEVLKDRAYPVIHFHGHMVEVKCDEKGLNELIGKVMRIKDRSRGIEELAKGLNTLRLYIAYQTDRVSPEIFEICERNGIGILRLQLVNDELINIYQVLAPQEIELEGIPHNQQRSPGIFEDNINSINFLRQMFQRPWKLYDDFIRPQIEDYTKKLKLEEWLDYLQNRYAKIAFEIFMKQVFTIFPALSLERHRGLAHNGKIVLQIEIGTGNFKIFVDDAMYRIYATDNIIEFKGKEEGKKYEGDIEKLINEIVIPYIEGKIRE